MSTLRPRAPLFAFAVLAATSGCATGTVDLFETCSLEVVPSVSAAVPGDTIVTTGGPYTLVRDTRVEVGGVSAEVTAVDRVGCEECDLCRADAGCAPCGPCFGELLTSAARTACFGDPLADPPVVPVCDACVESLSFVVPSEVPAGPQALYVVNANGASELVPFEVTGEAPGTGDTSDTDTP